jgi:hypothetical protein
LIDEAVRTAGAALIEEGQRADSLQARATCRSAGERLPAATEWATAGRSIRQRRIVAALIVSSEAWRCGGGAYKIRGAFLSAKEGSGSGCALPYRPPCLRRRPVSQSRKPGLLGSRTLRRSEQIRLRSESRGTAGWLPGGTTISTISLQRLVPNVGWAHP